MDETPPPSPLSLREMAKGEGSRPSSPSLLPQGEKGASRCARCAPSFTLGAGESDERHFNRLRWRCRRGLLELDLTLQSFLDRQFAQLTPPEQWAFEILLEAPDNTLLAYLHGMEQPQETELRQIVAKIRQ